MTKLDASGAALGYSTYLGGSGYDPATGIAVDGAGNAYLTGYTGSPDFPTTAGAFDTTYNGGGDAFVTKLNASGAALGYSTYLGGSGYDFALGIARRRRRQRLRDRAHATRRTSRRPRAPSTRPSTAADDAFVTKLDASGAALGYSSFLGGSGDDFGYGIALDGAGSAYLTGHTSRRTSRRPRAPSTRPTTAATTPS